jgi:hypothetical protein
MSAAVCAGRRVEESRSSSRPLAWWYIDADDDSEVVQVAHWRTFRPKDLTSAERK